MRNQNIHEAIARGHFAGTLKELKSLIKWSYLSGGPWSEIGSAVVFKEEARHPAHIYFWQATGNLLYCIRNEQRSIRRQTCLDWKWYQRLLPKPRKWNVYSFEDGAECSLPELIINRPRYFFESIMFGDADIKLVDKFELAEMMDKVRAIRLPDHAARRSRVVNHYDTHDHGRYKRFEISARPFHEYTKGGVVMIRNHIDLLDGAYTYDESWSFRTPIPSLMAAVDGTVSKSWPRKKCEAFFERPENFVPITKCYDRKKFGSIRDVSTLATPEPIWRWDERRRER